MRRNLVRRALAAAGVMALVASGIAISSSSAGAAPIYTWNYSNIDCAASSISFSIGSYVGGANGSGGNGFGGSNTYYFRTFCGLGLTPGHVQTQVPVNTEKSYVMPTYGGDRTALARGRAGSVDHLTRGDQFDAYSVDLANAYSRIFQDFDSPTPPPNAPVHPWDFTPARPNPTTQHDDSVLYAPWYAVHELALNFLSSVEELNTNLASYTPTTAHADIHYVDGWTNVTGLYGYYGNATARNGAVTSTNGWTWGSMSQDINGNLGGGVWAKGVAKPVGDGGVLAGCGAAGNAFATGGANATQIDQTWDVTGTFGCGITGGSQAQGGVVALTGLTVDQRLEFANF